MAYLSFDDLRAGQEFASGPVTVSRDDLVGFAKVYDPQPFHIDEAAAKNAIVGTLIGSGWQTAALGMRLLADGLISHASSMGSPGVEELRWLKPVLPGDTLRAAIRVENTRLSASKPDRGLARLTMTLRNGADEPVMTQAFTVLFARRGAQVPRRSVETGRAAEAIPESDDAVPLAFLKDAEIGISRELGCHRFDAQAIIAFAEAYDPQVFHLDAEAAARTHFGGLCASGWHTAAVWMKRLHATRERDRALTELSGPVPQLGPSPGFRDLRWLKPVYAGDTLAYAGRLVDKRESASRPGWGLATHHNIARNQRGERVFEFTGTVFWQWEP